MANLPMAFQFGDYPEHIHLRGYLSTRGPFQGKTQYLDAGYCGNLFLGVWVAPDETIMSLCYGLPAFQRG